MLPAVVADGDDVKCEAADNAEKDTAALLRASPAPPGPPASRSRLTPFFPADRESCAADVGNAADDDELEDEEESGELDEGDDNSGNAPVVRSTRMSAARLR
ncbi:hypothetical protein DWU98_15875 [Dyella monticola]|uniref:Uncharacterized protein n=1 Tax=Dyella monticola TaxID=1927958 RepID=A0A370WV50_9GAMM|nr:hypothetical protein [Dyella monticola]RDS79916.1 hypothetical protein DWU98_15875 [Dyella monticola]